MQLNLENSLCTIKQKEIISEEGGKKHHAHNKYQNDVRHYKLDGGLVSQQKCCDYLLLNDTKKQAYFIELKGNDIKKGIEQLKCGVKIFSPELSGYDILCRLVCSRAKTHNVHDSTFRKFKKEYGKKFKYKENILEENI